MNYLNSTLRWADRIVGFALYLPLIVLCLLLARGGGR